MGDRSSWSGHAANLAYVVMAGMVAVTVYLHSRSEVDRFAIELYRKLRESLVALKRNVPRTHLEAQVRDLLDKREHSES